MDIEFYAKEAHITACYNSKFMLYVTLEESEAESVIQQNAEKLKRFLVNLVASEFRGEVLEALGIKEQE